MKVVGTKAEVREATDAMRGAGERIAFVPTMGYLHSGHLSLIERATERADRVVLSIFVNPLQFGPAEDLDRYPRDMERDLELARSAGVDLVFTPDPGEMYPDGDPEAMVDPGPMGGRLCGAWRPGHFRGVLTVVAKLFSIVGPDLAIFGRKDFQQFVLIRQMVRDLDFAVELDGAPVLREDDGLAMSSRNAMLSPEDRSQAVGIHRSLQALEGRFRQGERRADLLLRLFQDELATHPRLRMQYAELVDPETLESVDRAFPGCVIAVAVFAGDTRLIDNRVLTIDVRRPDAQLHHAQLYDARRSGARRTDSSHSSLHPVVDSAGRGEFPEWTRAGEDRRAHMRRVAALMEAWAEGLGLPPEEVRRWKAAGILHDALREEDPDVLRTTLRNARPELADLPDALLHGPVAAVRLRADGVEDDELLMAITYHTTGHPALGRIGQALYAADFLEPARPILREWRAERRRRMPEGLEAVVRDLLEARIAHFARMDRPVRPETQAFWSALTEGAPLPEGRTR